MNKKEREVMDLFVRFINSEPTLKKHVKKTTSVKVIFEKYVKNNPIMEEKFYSFFLQKR